MEKFRWSAEDVEALKKTSDPDTINALERHVPQGEPSVVVDLDSNPPVHISEDPVQVIKIKP